MPFSDDLLLLTPAEVAKTLRLSARALRRITSAGQLVHVRIGRTVRYPAAAIDRMVRGVSDAD